LADSNLLVIGGILVLTTECENRHEVIGNGMVLRGKMRDGNAGNDIVSMSREVVADKGI
jgi:hypothetical protein